MEETRRDMRATWIPRILPWPGQRDLSVESYRRAVLRTLHLVQQFCIVIQSCDIQANMSTKMNRFVYMLCATAMGMVFLYANTSGAKAQSYWGKTQCYNSAALCRERCTSVADSCIKNCNSIKCRDDCVRKNRECLYVTCDATPCERIR